jgi:tetratricopeptide (TPR) repeat protein
VPFYEKALELNPRHAQAHFNLGSILAEQGKKAAAIEHLEQAVALDPNFAPAKQRLDELRAQP